MRPFFKDITEWYFTKNALPYWGILFLDCIGITLSYIVTILFVNMSGTTTMFDNGYLPITYGFLVSLFVYCLFFRLLHTYSGVIRYSNFKDLQNVVLSVLFASCLNILISLILIRLDVTCIIMFKPLGFFMMFVLSSLGLIFMRMLVRMVFEKTRSIDSAKGAFFFFNALYLLAKAFKKIDLVVEFVVFTYEPAAFCRKLCYISACISYGLRGDTRSFKQICLVVNFVILAYQPAAFGQIPFCFFHCIFSFFCLFGCHNYNKK